MLLIFYVEFIEFMLQILASNSVCSKSQGKPFLQGRGEVCWCLLCKNNIPGVQVQSKIRPFFTANFKINSCHKYIKNSWKGICHL